MPPIQLRAFVKHGGRAPAIDWLKNLMKKNPNSARKMVARIQILTEQGRDLGEPHSKKMQGYDEIYELRTPGRGACRVFYFFHATFACLSHGVKKADFDDSDIELAAQNKRLVEQN